MNYYKRHIGDYAKKAGHLSPLEHGVYTLLLDAYYDREQAPTKAEAIRITRCRSTEEIAALEAVLGDFFVEREGRYTQRRVEEEFAKAEVQARANSENGKQGGRPRKPKGDIRETERKANESESVFPENQSDIEINPNPLIHQSTNPQTQKKVLASPVGSRLPTDWTLPADWKAWALQERPEVSAEQEAAKFADYWQAIAGAKGRKADWQATWRNWIRNSNAPRTGQSASANLSVAENFRGNTYAGTPINQLPPSLRAAAEAALAGDG